jgi:hypothetical protein
MLFLKNQVDKDYDKIYKAMKHIGQVIKRHSRNPKSQTTLNQKIIEDARSAVKNHDKLALKYHKSKLAQYNIISQSFIEYHDFFNSNGYKISTTQGNKSQSDISSVIQSREIEPLKDYSAEKQTIKSQLQEMGIQERYIVAHYLNKTDEKNDELTIESFNENQEENLSNYCNEHGVDGNGKTGYIFENKNNKLEDILIDLNQNE